MKYLLITLTTLLICFHNIDAQHITEVQLNHTKSYNPLFSKAKSSISFDFLKSYTIGDLDTTYTFLVYLFESSLEESSVSVGTTLFSSAFISGGSMSYGSNYNVEKSEGSVLFNKEEFQELYHCISNVYKHIIELSTFKRTKKTTLASCSTNQLTFGGEYIPNSDLTKFTFNYLTVHLSQCQE